MSTNDTHRRGIALVVGILSLTSLEACKRKPASTGTVADDPKAACEARAKWTRADKKICKECIEKANEEPCTCDAYRGSCFKPRVASMVDTDCDPKLRLCVERCKADCGCLDGCYAGHDKCRAAIGAADACIANHCDAVCR